MIFHQPMIDKILAGTKTVTRRPVKYDDGKPLPCRYKVGGGPGGTYALQGPPEKGSGARSKTIPGYRLRVVSVGTYRLGNIQNVGAEREGFTDRLAFLRYWAKLYGLLWPDEGQRAWRIEFELVEA